MKTIKIHPVAEINPITDSNSKDWAMIETMMKLARKTPQHGMTKLDLYQVTRKTKLALLMVPLWGVFFPPYNLSRLSGVTAAAGYNTKVYDINVKAWHHLQDKTSLDLWDPSKEWMWQGKWYEETIRPHLEPLLEQYIEMIVQDNPSVIGLSLYYTNESASNWVAERLRSRLPNAKIIAGGPQALCLTEGMDQHYNHIIKGEGEQVVLDLLEKIENNQPIESKVLTAATTRIDLDSLPFPDYSHYDLNEYRIPNGISAELSRGCVANCIFCNEVNFWKYRGRMSGTVLDEIEFQYKTYNIDYVWFIDSLVNGNLKELRAFTLGLLARGVKINWQGYARCDGRMDLSYYTDLANSGCCVLDYGIESGSQKVLNDMRKNITVEEIENNLRDSNSVGIKNSTNWLIGFPTEQTSDFADTLTLVWRIQYWLNNMSTGLTMMLSPGSDIAKMEDSYNIAPYDFQGSWALFDLTSTKFHRLVRQKSFLIFLQHLIARENIAGINRPGLAKTYNIEYQHRDATIDFEKFDYNIIKPNINQLANSLVNEIWPLLRMLWRAHGAYKITVKFDPVEDLNEWGNRLAGNYTANHYFEIDADGKWSADFSYEFVQEPEDYNNNLWSDYSFKYHWANEGYWL
jgi:hypothetical protein